MNGTTEYVCVHENATALNPVNISLKKAADVVQAAAAALQGLCGKGQIKAGAKTLIYGTSG